MDMHDQLRELQDYLAKIDPQVDWVVDTANTTPALHALAQSLTEDGEDGACFFTGFLWGVAYVQRYGVPDFAKHIEAKEVRP